MDQEKTELIVQSRLSPRCRLICKDPSLAQQHFKKECDMKNIIERYRKKGELPVQRVKPLFGDFSNGYDLLEMQNKLISAQAQFDALPSRIRRRFNNNPAELVDFMQDEKNFDEAVEIGLMTEKEKEAEQVNPEKKGTEEKTTVTS